MPRRHQTSRAEILARALVVVALALAAPALGARQAGTTLRITVALPNAQQQLVPVPRHVLLVSDNPATTAPRRVVTGADGIAVVKLPPGNYTVESDHPVAFLGREYQWTQTLDVPAGRDTTLTLSVANAEAGAVTAASAEAPPKPVDPSDILTLWQPSVVGLWTPTARAIGFVIDARGLVATSQQMVGRATSIEVQVTPTMKMRGDVLVADAVRDVAILRIDPTPLAGITPLPLDCAPAAKLPLKDGVQIQTFDTASGRRVRLAEGAVRRTSSRTMLAEFSLDEASVGGPAFTAAGALIGLTSLLGEKEGDAREESRVVRLDAVCEAVSAATAKLASAAAPLATPLPMEPAPVIPTDTLREVAKRRAGSLAAATATSPGFDIQFLTPLQVYAGEATMDFANWRDYVLDTPSVLLVRVTPKMAEKFWATLARGVAMTQGIALPPIKSFKAGFGRLRAFCGEREVTPIHPFLLERRVSQTDAVHEGLYAFDPDALVPDCGTVRLELYADKDGAKAEVITVEPKTLGQIWMDFAPYRAMK